MFDTAFTHVSGVETLSLDSSFSAGLTLGANAAAAGITSIDGSGDSHNLTVTVDTSALPSFGGISLTGGGVNTLTLEGSISDLSGVFGVQTLALDNSFSGASVTLGNNSSDSGVSIVDASADSHGVVINTSDDFSVTHIIGGGGNDTLTVGTGGDTMTGGDGADTFVITADAGEAGKPLVITDFHSGTDKLDLSAAIHGLNYVSDGAWFDNIYSSIDPFSALSSPSVVFMSDGTNGWLAFEGGGALDGTVVELTGVTTAPVSVSDFVGSTITTPTAPVGTVVHDSGQQAAALTFSAAGQYADAGNIFNVGTGDFTIEAWVNSSGNTGGDQMVVAKDGGIDTTGPVMSLYLDSDGIPVFHMQGFNLAGGSGGLYYDGWTHLAVTRSGDQYTLYVNGVAVQSMVGPVSDLSNAFDLMIGARTGTDPGGIDGNTTFQGQIADVNLLSTALSQDAVAASMHVGLAADTPGLVASWSGTDTTDTSGNGHDLTLNGGATTDAGSPPVYEQLVEIHAGQTFNGLMTTEGVGNLSVSYSLDSNPDHGGTLTFNPDGSFVYTPAVGYVGIDTFVVTATVSGHDPITETVAMDVGSTVAIQGESFTVQYGATYHGDLTATSGTNAIFHWTPAEGNAGDPVTTAHGGTVTVNDDGSFTYTSAPGWYGTDSFVVEATGASDGVSVEQTITIDVPSPVVVGKDTISSPEGSAVSGTLSAVDTADSGATLSADVIQQAAHGTVTFTDGLSYTYIPADNYFGKDSFVVGIDDGSGNLTYETVQVQVREPTVVSNTGDFTIGQGSNNVLSYSINDPTGANANQLYRITLTAADGDITLDHTDGLSFLGNTANGGHSLIFQGTLDRVQAALESATYVGDSHFSGTDSITMTAWNLTDDPTGAAQMSTVDTVTVTPVDLAPVILAHNGMDTFSANNGAVTAAPVLTATDNFTVIADVNWSGTDTGHGSQFIFYNGNSATSGFGLYVDSATGKLGYMTGGVDTSLSSVVLSPDEWHQVGLVRDHGVWSLYVDGAKYALPTQLGMNDYSSDAGWTSVGNAGTGVGTVSGISGFAGSILDVQVWDSVRSESQITAGMGVQPTGGEAGLVGLWDFNQDDLSSSSPNRASGGTSDTALVNTAGASFATSGTPAVIGTATHTGTLAAIAPEGAHITYQLDSYSGPGSVTVDPDTGVYIYTGPGGHVGFDSFTWKAVDSTNITNTTTHTETFMLFDHATTLTGGGTLGFDGSGVVNASAGTYTHATGGEDTVGGLTLNSAAFADLTAGTLTVDVGGVADSSSGITLAGGTLSLAAGGMMFEDSGGFTFTSGGLTGFGTLVADGTGAILATVGQTDQLDATLVLTKGGTMTGGTMTGAGTLVQSGGTLTLSGIGNDIGVAFQNAAATLLLVEAFSGSGTSAVFEHTLLNVGTIDLDSQIATYASALTVDGMLTNDGTLISSGSAGAGDHTLIVSTLDNESQMQIDHNLMVTADSFFNAGLVVLSGGVTTTLTVQDDAGQDPSTHASFTNRGIISGSGSINDHDAIFTNDGYLSPGDAGSSGTLHISGDMTLAGDSHLAMDVFLDGGAGSSDTLSDSGSLTLGGELALSEHGSSSPVGLTYTLLEWTGGFNGEFGAIHGLDNAADGWVLDPTFSNVGGVGSLTVTGHSATVLAANAGFSDTSATTSDYVIGNIAGGNDVHLGGGEDVFIGHGGGNTVGVSDTSFHFLDGGSGGGNELVWEGGASTVLDFTKLQVNAVQNFDVLNLAGNGGASATLDLTHLLSMTNGTNTLTGDTNTLVVIGGVNSQVTFEDANWTQGPTENLTVDGHQDSYTQYSNGNVHVLLDSHTTAVGAGGAP